jgi:hypothetical protein
MLLVNMETQRKKRAIAIATAHLFFWFFVLGLLARKAPEAHQVFIAAGIALFVAAWIQYRAVLAYRRAAKSEESTHAGTGTPPMRRSSP